MAHNKINDLRDHLFASLERLDNDELTPEQLQGEIKKAEAVAVVAGAIIQSAKVEIDFLKAMGKAGTETELFKDIDNQKRIA